MKIKILIIDDNPACLELMKRALDKLPDFDFEIAVAANGDEAMRLAIKDPPQVILCDMHLGRTTGYEVARQCDREPAVAKSVRVAITGLHQTLSNKLEARQVGFHDVLYKPLDPRALIAIIKPLLCPTDNQTSATR